MQVGEVKYRDEVKYRGRWTTKYMKIEQCVFWSPRGRLHIHLAVYVTVIILHLTFPLVLRKSRRNPQSKTNHLC